MPPTPPDPSRWSDAELVAACREGEARAWRELVRRFQRLVYGLPLALGLQPADADEVFQHTFSELLRALPHLREPARVEAWLVTAARRASLRVRREERLRERRSAEWARETRLADPSAGAGLEVERLREAERLQRILDSLGEPCRTLLRGLFSDPRRSYRELARELGLAVGSLGSIRARCLERLRARLRSRRSSAPRAARKPEGGRP